MEMQVFKPNFKRTVDDIEGLALVVIQDHSSQKVLMVAFTDEAGWRQTLATGLASLYSTSRKKSWVKGEESGNFMKVVEMRIDCDGDTMVYVVEPQGNRLACHTGTYSCFYRGVVGLYKEIPPNESPQERLLYTTAGVHADIRV
jgi:phosphoribosyl-AMP cyclohydrolase